MATGRQPTTLVTGGAGFIGSHLCDRLIAEGWRVVCLDNLITGTLENLEGLKREPRFRFVRHDISQPIYFKEPIHAVWHFASPASPRDYLDHPIQTLKVGSLGTHNALGIAKAHRAKFLLASTSEVYGDPEVHPQKETYWGHVNPIGPRGVYDEAKRFAEALTMAYHRVHHVNTRIARIFNSFGERMRLNDGRAIPNFIMQVLTGRPITVYGTGKQTRSFCYIDDLIEGLWRLMRAGYHEPMNLGNPKELSILKLASVIREVAGANGHLAFRSLPQDDPKQRRPDITVARRVLNWEPRVPLEEGLHRTIGWFRQRDELVLVVKETT